MWVAIRYVEENAVRALLVNSAEEYKWSSAWVHADGAREKAPVLDGEFWEAAGGADAWRRLHGRPDRVQEVRLLRRCTYAGRPFGEEEFVREIGRAVSSPLAAVGIRVGGHRGGRRGRGRCALSSSRKS